MLAIGGVPSGKDALAGSCMHGFEEENVLLTEKGVLVGGAFGSLTINITFALKYRKIVF
jgi:hypothetical protein